jgi:hypothetical protein
VARMSTSEVVVILAVAGVILALCAFVVVRGVRIKGRPRVQMPVLDENSRAVVRDLIREARQGEIRFEVQVVDFGPDHPEQAGRYRWNVWDADRHAVILVRDASYIEVIGVDVPYMVGNDATSDDARRAAVKWVVAWGGDRAALVVRP